jgi:hypothetical protein
MEEPMTALLDCGATKNFVRVGCLKECPGMKVQEHEEKMTIRLADGKPRSVPKRSVRMKYVLGKVEKEDVFFAIEMDTRFDCIFGMPWFERHDPQVDWKNRSVKRIDVVEGEHDDDSLATIGEVWWMNLSDSSAAPRVTAVCDGPAGSGIRESTQPTPSGELSSCTSQTVKTPSILSEKEKRIRVRSGPHPSKRRRTRARRARRSEESSIDLIVDNFLAGERVNESSADAVAADDVGSQSESSGENDLATGEEDILAVVCDNDAPRVQKVRVPSPPRSAGEVCMLGVMSAKRFLKDLKHGEIEQVCVIVAQDDLVCTTATDGVAVCEKTQREQRFHAQSVEALKDSNNAAYPLVMEFQDVFPEEVPKRLPPDRGVRHEIDLMPGTKYCVMRQWPLPRDQVEAIDKFFEARKLAGHVRESISPHSSPTFCVKKATGGWRIVHAFNKLNDATIPAQTPIPRKDMILDSMSGSVVYSAIDLMDGFYQILMREQDIPLTAVSTPSGMLWEWLVMPQGLKNAPATFNRMVSHVLRPFRSFAPSYFDDIFVHSKAEGDKSADEVHLDHLRRVFEVMREHQLFANLKKCVFFAPEIPVLGCYVSKNGVRPDPEKVASICAWPVPRDQKQLRQWLGLANYLHKYTKNYAAMVHPLSQLLRKDVDWSWTDEHQRAFNSIKSSLQEAPVLALPDYDRPFHVVCDASDYAIGCALMQHDAEGRERVISYQSRQLKTAEKNYPVHDKELLAMKYALVKFRVYLLGEQQFAIYTDHASLRTATKTPLLSQRMARWLSFFAEYNFVVHYKPGKSNILADALSRRPDYDPRAPADMSSALECPRCVDEGINTVAVSAQSSLSADIQRAYQEDPVCSELIEYLSAPSESKLVRLSPHLRSRVRRYHLADGLLYYHVDSADAPRVVVPNDDDLRFRLIHEHHDAPAAGHLGREKTFLSLSRDFYWPHQYRWVRKWVRSCETCQRVKPAPALRAPLRPLPVPADVWDSVSLDFVFGFPKDSRGRDGIMVFVDRLSKMVHLAAVKQTITAAESAAVFLDSVFRLHGLPETLVSDRDPRFTSLFWRSLFKLLNTRHPRVPSSFVTGGSHSSEGGVSAAPTPAAPAPSASGATPVAEPAVPTPAAVPFAYDPAPTQASKTDLADGRDPDCDAPTDPDDNRDFQYAAEAQPLAWDESQAPSANEAADADANMDDVSNPIAGVAEEEMDVNCVESVLATLLASATLEKDSIEFNFDALPDLATLSSREERLINDFVEKRQAIIRFVRDSVADAVDRQKAYADSSGRSNRVRYDIGDRVLLSTQNLPERLISHLGSSKLLPRYIGPFRVTNVVGDAYTLQLPPRLRLHPTFYVGRLKPYQPPGDLAADLRGETPRRSRLHPDQSSRTPTRPRTHPSEDACATATPRLEPVRALMPPHEDDATRGTPLEKPCATAQGTAIDPRAASLDESSPPARSPPRLDGLHYHQSFARDPQSRMPRLARDAAPSPQEVPADASPLDADDHSRSPGHEDVARGTPGVGHEASRGTSRDRPVAGRPTNHDRAGVDAAPANGRPVRFVRDGPPPLVDASGELRWVVDRIVDHDDRPDPVAAKTNRQRKKKKQGAAAPLARFYRVHWLGYPDDQDTWEHGPTLALEVPGLVRLYEDQLRALPQRA